MMAGASALCSSNPISQRPLSAFISHRFLSSYEWRHPRAVSASISLHFPMTLLQKYGHALSPLHSAATQEIVESSETLGFIEIGYLSSVHGLQGEICVKPRTDFPELRFSKPGRRWVRKQVLGRETIEEVELVEGRGHPGQKSWILKFKGIDMVDEAKQLVGSTLLAREEDRPELEEGEFYTHDLVGMRVVLKETGALVGTVVNVFETGASDLLQVKLETSIDMPNGSAKPKSKGSGESGALVWVPFVEAIVPDVDLNKRELQITPPKGLLELNLRSDERSKKERRQLEWKERKKFQKRLTGAKKKLCELDQQHVLDGFSFGDKSQRNLLAEQIIGVNSKLFQQALQNMGISLNRWNVPEQIRMARTKQLGNILKISEDCITLRSSEDKLGKNLRLQQKGLQLMSKGKVAISLVVKDSEKQYHGYESDLVDLECTEDSSLSLLQELLSDEECFMKIEDRVSMPLVLVCPTHAIQPLRTLFLNNDHFAFDPKKVWFLEEEKLPVVSITLEEQKKYKILMKSPWEILQSPVGSGGVLTSLSSHNILENLTKMGVEYVQICSADVIHIACDSLLLGFVDSQEAEIGIKLPKDTDNLEESFNMIFSIDSLTKLTKQIHKQFYTIPKAISHVEKVDKEWVSIAPSSPNSYGFCSSIYSCLNTSWPNKICLMEITG